MACRGLTVARLYDPSAHRHVLVLALRGPFAVSTWNDALGPVDPTLARRTDPQSLRAKYGRSATDSLVACPHTKFGARREVRWWFGGRVDADAVDARPQGVGLLSVPTYVTSRLCTTGRCTLSLRPSHVPTLWCAVCGVWPPSRAHAIVPKPVQWTVLCISGRVPPPRLGSIVQFCLQHGA